MGVGAHDKDLRELALAVIRILVLRSDCDWQDGKRFTTSKAIPVSIAPFIFGTSNG